jgi:cysteine desulfurase
MTLYFDNAATTPVVKEAAEAALEAMTEAWGNPSSAHRLGAEAARRVAEARQKVARAIGAEPAEVTFTSGGTEANGLVLRGVAEAVRGRHLVLSGFEHPSVADTARALGEHGRQAAD